MFYTNPSGFIPIPLIVVALIAGLIGGTAVTKTVVENQQKTEISAVSPSPSSSDTVRQSLPQGSAISQEVIIGFKSNVNRSQRDKVHQKHQAQVKKPLSRLNADVVSLPPGLSVADAAIKYKSMPEVAYVEPNFLATSLAEVNDPYFGKQWNLQKVGATTAYDTSQGGNTLIAVVDTGVDTSHPDLSAVTTTGFNAITNTTNAFDDNGHGTHVAGIAAAHTNNGTGVASIAYKATILPVKVLDKDGVGTYADVAEGITYAADKGARIVNLSLGGSSDSLTLKQAVSYAQNKGSIVVAAAGNNGSSTPSYPAAYAGVLAVSASDSTDSLASFSNYGSNVFVAAPGVSILSSTPGSGYQSLSGTSMAAPHVAGLIALTLSYKPTLSNTEVIDAIKQSSEKVGSATYDQNGWNQYFGYGRISAATTLSKLATVSPTPTPTPTPSPTPAATTKEKSVPTGRGKSQKFQSAGTVTSKNLASNSFSLKVEQGSPHIFRLLVNNMVEISLNAQTKVTYQGQINQLSSIPDGARVNVAGDLVNNILTATDVTAPIDTQPASQVNYNSSQTVQANSSQGNSSNAQAETPGNNSQTSTSTTDDKKSKPEQAQTQGRGNNDKVKGTYTLSFFNLLKQKLLFWTN